MIVQTDHTWDGKCKLYIKIYASGSVNLFFLGQVGKPGAFLQPGREARLGNSHHIVTELRQLETRLGTLFFKEGR